MIVWFTILVIICSLLFSWVSDAAELPPVPHSKTVIIGGEKHECFNTEQYRRVVQYVTVVAPSLQHKVYSLHALLDAQADENVARYDYSLTLEHKLTVYKLDLTATRTELEDVKGQIKSHRNDQQRATVMHYIIHGLGLVAVISLGTAYGLERIK